MVEWYSLIRIKKGEFVKLVRVRLRKVVYRASVILTTIVNMGGKVREWIMEQGKINPSAMATPYEKLPWMDEVSEA